MPRMRFFCDRDVPPPEITPAELAGADEPAGQQLASKLNWLRAGVMGANDGIVSTAGMVVGVAGAAVNHNVLLLSGIASLVAGAISMGVGEYVSVCSQRDSERSEIEHERNELAAHPRYGLRQLTGLIQAQGIDATLAQQVAEQLTEKDAVTAHTRLELGIDPSALANPWTAAAASMLSYVCGGVLPFAAAVLPPRDLAVPVTAAAVIVGLAITGAVAARLGHAPKLPATLRTVAGGVLAMAVAYAVGALIGAAT
jgi:vacuolar iron transporter family protein